MQRTALIRIGTDAKASETEMREKLSKSISDPQSDRPKQGLGCDRPRFTTLVTRARSYTLPDPMLKQTKTKDGLSIRHVSRYEAKDLLPSLQTIVGPDKRVTECPHSPASMLIRTLTTRPNHIIIETIKTVLLHGSNLSDQSRTLHKCLNFHIQFSCKPSQCYFSDRVQRGR